MAQLPPNPPPYQALRLARKAGGLFDTGSTSVAGNTTTLVGDLPEDNYDLFAALETEDDIFAESANSLLPSLEESLNSGMAESDFLEGFVDLSQFLGLQEDLPALMEEHVEKTPIKRKAADAFATEQAQSNPDHDCYVSKKSRLASVSSCAMSECDNEEGMPSCSSTSDPVEKYRHRRHKNNIASKRSRETRKQKFSNMEKVAVELEKANAELKQKVEHLEQLTKQMKDSLVKKLAAK